MQLGSAAARHHEMEQEQVQQLCASVVDPSNVQGVGAVCRRMWLCSVHQKQELHTVMKKQEHYPR